MGFGRYRFRRSFGQVKAQFRGARPKFYPLFTGLLDTYAGAAAAYSLRRLSKIASSVVRVRRASDNAEKDFTADNITDGAMVNWVNGQIVPPLDIRELDANGERTGDLVEAAAAYSLRNLSDSYAGDVVEVRRNTDGSTQDFNATEVSDNTLTDWVNTSFADDLPLDTSSGAAAAYSLRNLSSSFTGSVVEVRRSSDGEEDSFTAAEVADGTLTDWVVEDVADLIDDARYFNGVDNSVAASSLPSISASEDFSLSFYVVTGSDVNSIQGLIGNFRSSADRFQCSISGGYIVTSFYTTNYIRTKSVPIEANTSYFVEISQSGTTLSLTVNGVVGLAGTRSQSRPSRQFTVGCLASSSSYFTELNGIIYDVKVFDEPTFTSQVLAYTGLGTSTTAWEDTIGSNDGTETNGVTFTGQGYDGFVAKWYDQSGNANHATQGTDASQPKIVDAGVLVSDGIDFDGVNDYLITAQSGQFSQPVSLFQVFSSDVLSASDYQMDATSNIAMLSGGDGSIYYYGGSLLDSNIDFPTGGDTLHSVVFNGSSSTVFADGLSVATGNVGSSNFQKTFSIGARKTGAQASNISYKEIIIYNSDQSDKRRAIEENIGDHYGITLASFSNDGFVKTWYDQSGNTNHATQAVDASQPKIVEGGSLVSGGLDFDGADDQLDFTALNATDLAIFSVVQFDSVSGQERILGEDSSNSEGFGIANATTGFFRASGGSAAQPALNATVSTSGAFLYSANRASNTLGFFTQGVASATATNSDAFNANSIGGATNPVDGSIQELIIYDSDQSDNRTAIEANIGETYSIDLPSGVDTGYDQVDGFVETWYDQSGNGNDAVQQVSGNQPKIVDAGVLVSGGLDFDGLASYLNLDSALNLVDNCAIFSAITTSTTLNVAAFLSRNNNAQGVNIQSNGFFSRVVGSGSSGSFGFSSNTNEKIVSALTSNESVTAFQNGTASSDNPKTESLSNNSVNQLGGNGNGSNYWLGTIQEIILYPSDQSANRVAIETNINNQYDIY